MNTLELILNGLIHEKNVLEFELERIVNNKDMGTLDKITISKDILSKLINTINMINLVTGYLQPKNNEMIENNNN
jgi:hypothetical protein